MTTIIAIVIIIILGRLPTIILLLTHEADRKKTKVTISITIADSEQWEEHLLNQEALDSTRDLGPQC